MNIYLLYKIIHIYVTVLYLFILTGIQHFLMKIQNFNHVYVVRTGTSISKCTPPWIFCLFVCSKLQSRSLKFTAQFHGATVFVSSMRPFFSDALLDD